VRTIVQLVEPQGLFTQALIDVFMEAGLEVDHTGPELDVRRTIDNPPDIIFFDADYLTQPLEAIRLARVLARNATIIMYTSAAQTAVDEAFGEAGADIVLQKSAERRTIVQRLRTVERERRHGIT